MLSITKNLLMSSIIFYVTFLQTKNYFKKYDGLYQQFDSTYVEYSWPKFPVTFNLLHLLYKNILLNAFCRLKQCIDLV